MDPWRLVDTTVFFTFFCPLLVRRLFFLFGGALRTFFCRTAPLRQAFGLYKFVLDLVWGFCFKSFLGPR